MKRCTVFEAGSRAGLSARMFFEDYKRKIDNDDVLYMVDIDNEVIEALYLDAPKDVISTSPFCKCVCIGGNDFVVFPADELTRQKGEDVAVHKITRSWFNDVVPSYYSKYEVNKQLSEVGVRIPATFYEQDVFIKPNRLSAGSRGLMNFDEVCVQKRLQIAHEYVVDATVAQDGTVLGIVARETKLRAGYDKLIRFVPSDHPATLFALDVIKKCPTAMFRGVCHLQICETEEKGNPFYYIEGSKRISGTSLVNIAVGYNPFVLLSTGEPMAKPEEHGGFDGGWHMYEEMIIRVNSMIHDKKC